MIVWLKRSFAGVSHLPCFMSSEYTFFWWNSCLSWWNEKICRMLGEPRSRTWKINPESLSFVVIPYLLLSTLNTTRESWSKIDYFSSYHVESCKKCFKTSPGTGVRIKKLRKENQDMEHQPLDGIASGVIMASELHELNGGFVGKIH